LETFQKITKTFIQNIYKPIPKTTHKGIQGHALLIGGSYGKIGSVCLSSKAALHSGCGLVTAYVPRCGYEIVQVAFLEAMVLTDTSAKFIENIQFNFCPNAIGIGMGIGQEQQTQIAFHSFLKTNKSPLIVDADALNILSQNKKWLTLLPKETIITPHKKELERLLGDWKTDTEKLDKIIKISIENQLVIVVKGAPTLIVYGENVYENTTGNQALATAGSGDVLTGIITSLVAQNYEPINAAILGVYLHGLTADIAAPKTGFESFIASDIINYLGKAFLSIQN
jgi:ADP-dependent NAD(P)H-hydrate dehydratase